MIEKLTPEEIIKALECCISAESCCVCGYTKMCDGTTIHQFALDLINRQQAEIERLKAGVKVDLDNFASEYDTKIKAEAIKEVEAKIHEKLHEAEMHGNFEPVVTREMFDSVVKEMVGDDNVD